MPSEIIGRFPLRRPALYHLYVLQGATLTLAFGFVETLAPKAYLPFGAGWSARARVKATYDGPTLLDMTTTNGRIVLGVQGSAPDQYNCLITVPASVTDALSDWGEGLWDLEIQDPFGTVERWVEGYAYLSRSVTR